MRMITVRVGSPIEINPGFRIPKTIYDVLRHRELHGKQLYRSDAANNRCTYVKNVLATQELERSTIGWQNEMVIACNSVFAYIQTASPRKLVVAIHPYIKILAGFTTAKANEHVFDDASTL
jgi:hypothetical protein